jgi:hypothetical protein
VLSFEFEFRPSVHLGRIRPVDLPACPPARLPACAPPPACAQPGFKYLGKTPCISSEKGTSWQKDKGMEVGGNTRK